MYINSQFSTGSFIAVNANYKPYTTEGPTLEFTDKKILNNKVNIVFYSKDEVITFAENLLKVASNDSFPIID